MAMEGLGRIFDVVPIAANQVLKMRGAASVTFVCTGADTFTVTVGTSHAAAATTPGNVIDHYYQKTGTDGTGSWSKVTQAAANTIVQAGANTTVFTIHGVDIPDTYKYIKVAPSAAGLVKAIFHDLVVQRAPANLEVLNA